MNKKSILSILAIIIVLITGLFTLSGCSPKEPTIDNSIKNQVLQNIIANNPELEEHIVEIDKVEITNEIKDAVKETIEATLNEEIVETTEIIESSPEEEKEIFDEGMLEIDGVVDQENISYNGDLEGNGLHLLGAYQGQTYYSQADSRWANKLYTSTNNKRQTMKSSACGPTSAAMVVSSSKGAILPPVMADLFVENGFRTASSGTAWSAFPFVADYFDFEEYYTTVYLDKAISYLSQKHADGSSKYYAIVSVGSGCFTTGGHYIVLTGSDGTTIQVADPYLYNGKFNTASRRAAGVHVDGNYAYITKDNFREYANYKTFWIFSNDQGNGTQVSVYKAGDRKLVSKPAVIAFAQGDSYIVDDGSAQFWIKQSMYKDGKVYGEATIAFVSGNSYIVDMGQGIQFWAKEHELLDITTKTTVPVNTPSVKSTVGKTVTFKGVTNLYSKSNLTGTKYTYKAGTQARIVENISSTVDKVYIAATGRTAYINVSNYKEGGDANQAVAAIPNTVGKTYRLKATTTLYSQSNLSGIKYTYKANTQVQVLQNVSSTVDKVKIPATGRVAYINKINYK